ncbi:DUF1254 domain-containing protein [Paraburkholderia fungorum]|uniref:DUF1254 domain-containing protein n=1 Tax=Paraburkholderia fungorum TaxID=134537 RepID=UPI0038BC7D1E
MPDNDDPRVALVSVAATPLAIYGYPLVEVMRTCALHTPPDATSPLRAPFNTIHASMRRWTHEDRDIVTPANDFLYLNGWIDLSAGPVTLDIPAAEAGRYFVIELLDAFTNNFVNISSRTLDNGACQVVLHLPGHTLEAGAKRTVACPTALVWLLGRVLVTSDADLPAAQRIAAGFRSNGPRTAGPACVSRWCDTGDAALDFFQNLFDALRDVPPRADETGLFGLLARAGLRYDAAVDIAALPLATQQGLRLAYAQALRLIEAHTQSRARRSWSYNVQLGQYGSDYLLRACTAMKGLGALSADEAVYAVADFDETGQRLDGTQGYELIFPPGGLPPVDALWSLSLYAADRFFATNPLGRYAIGDRTPGLQYDAEGGLRIVIQHEAPPSTTNWLPAPATPFYLILRFYHPRAEFLDGRYTIPAVRPLQN